MDTKVLEYILAIAEEKSVSRAAERFYLSHQALYRHLKNVEQDLGTPIFTRGTAGLQLTQAGALYVNDAQAILHAERELEKKLRAMRHRNKKRIRIMVDSHFQNRFLKAVEPRFQALHADFILKASPCNAVQARRALLDGYADLAVFDSTTTQVSNLECLPFTSMDLMLAFPKDYAGTADIPGLRSAVEGGMFIILFPVGTTARSMEEQQLAAHQIYPTHILEGAVQNSITHISNGGTCGILPAAFCTPEVRACIRIGNPFYTAHSLIAYPPGTSISPSMQDLMQIIIEEFPER